MFEKVANAFVDTIDNPTPLKIAIFATISIVVITTSAVTGMIIGSLL